MFGQRVHQTIHLICLLLTAFLMPVSEWLLSAFSITMAANWLLSGNPLKKIRLLRERPDMLMLLLLFGMYLLWLVNTSDYATALTELRLKLPLLLFPVVIGTSGTISNKVLRMAFLSFITGCVVAVSAGFFALAGLWPGEVNDSRDLALFVPSIRLSVMLNFAIFIALWLGSMKETGGVAIRSALATAAAVMVFFLFRLLSVTGIVIFVTLLIATGIFIAVKEKRYAAGLTLTAASAVVIAASVILMTSARNSLLHPEIPEVNIPVSNTPSGAKYTHYPEETLVENGYLVWMNVCEEELRKEWNSRSTISYDETDNTCNELRVTLIRYISFLGMTKDSAAVAALSDADIKNIERGFATPLQARIGSPMAKAYELAWQIDRAMKGSNPSGHSVTQRLEFYRASRGIIRKHPFFGVGTGDVVRAYKQEYEINHSLLTDRYRLLSHNQYLGFAVTFGIPGALVALVLLLMPWLRSPNRTFYPFLIFISIILLSMFNDDTFHSSVGATFFSYFYTLLLMIESHDT